VKLKNNKNITPITKELKGPTPDITISLLGVFGSSSIFETPPNRYNSISLTLSPYFCAIKEWNNSWIKIENKIIMPLIIATSMISAIDASGTILKKKVVAEKPTKPTISNVEKCNLILIPLIVLNFTFLPQLYYKIKISVESEHKL